jgi:hypothetical protein
MLKTLAEAARQVQVGWIDPRIPVGWEFGKKFLRIYLAPALLHFSAPTGKSR